MTRFISAEDARSLLTIPDSLRAVEEAYRLYGKERSVSSEPSLSFMIVPNEAPTMFWMKGACLKELGVAGVFFGPQFGDYYMMVSDCKTGTLRGVIEQSWLVKRRTAVTAVVTAMKLSRKGSTVAALVGADTCVRVPARATARLADAARAIASASEVGTKAAEKFEPMQSI